MMQPDWKIDEIVNTSSISESLRPGIRGNLILTVQGSTPRGWYMLTDETRERVFEWEPGETGGIFGDVPRGLYEDLD